MRLSLIYAASITAAVGLALAGALLWRASVWERAPQVRLSVFEPHAGGCAWYRHDVEHQDEREIAHFPTDCATAQVSWQPLSHQALVWFTPEGFPSREDMLFKVDVARGKLKRLPLPESGEAQTYLIDRGGRLLAFTEDQTIGVMPGEGTGTAEGPENMVIEFEGQRYKTSDFPEGQDELVHALALDETTGRWTLLETKASRCCAEGAPGVKALQLYGELARDEQVRERQSARLLAAPGAYQEVHAEELPAQLAKRLPPGMSQAAGPWLRLQNPAWPRSLLFRGTATEVSHATGLAFFEEGGHIRRLPGFHFAPNDVLQLMVHGSYLLVAEFATGMDPHLYDMRTGQLVYSNGVGVGATFWPE